MRNTLLLAAAMAGLLCGGCGGGEEEFTTFVDEVSLKVANPANATSEGFSGPIWDENGNHGGMRHIHTATDTNGAKRECTVELVGSWAKSESLRLRINGKSYGSVVKGDSVVIDGDAVKVNGEVRVVAK